MVDPQKIDKKYDSSTRYHIMEGILSWVIIILNQTRFFLKWWWMIKEWKNAYIPYLYGKN